MAVTGQFRNSGRFVLALVRYESENNCGPATVRTGSGAQLRRYLARWFDGDFHRFTCRSDRDLNKDSHTGFRLSLTALVSSPHRGGSYLPPKSFREITPEAVVLRPAPSDHLNLFVILDERMDVCHGELPIAQVNPILHKFIAYLLWRKSARMSSQNGSDRIEGPQGRIQGRRRFSVKLLIGINHRFPSINRLFDT